MEYKISRRALNINEYDCVAILKEQITAIFTCSVWKSNKVAVREEQAWETEVCAFSFLIPSRHRHQIDVIQGLLDNKDVFLSVCTDGGISHCVTNATEWLEWPSVHTGSVDRLDRNMCFCDQLLEYQS